MTNLDDTQPAAAGLLGLASDYLRNDLRPSVEGRHRFLALVAANALDIVQREMTLGPAAARSEAARLVLLLGSEDTIANLNHILCEGLAEGRLDERTPGLIDHLFKTTMDRLAIDQPRYAAYRDELSGTDKEGVG